MSVPVGILQGDALSVLETLPDSFVQCVVTSPPYWGLRDYGVEGQLGLEKTPQEYIEKMTAVFREVRRVLRADGTCWVNMGDSYAGGGNYRGVNSENTLSAKQASNRGARGLSQDLGARGKETGCKPKDLVGIPWRLAFALQADGWFLRSDIIWHKPNPMPESVTDRPTKAHEYLFLLSKSQRYYYNAEAIREPQSEGTHERFGKNPAPSSRRKMEVPGNGTKNNSSFDAAMTTMIQPDSCRNKRTVWTIPTQGYRGAHFATFPEALVEPCILAGTPASHDAIVLDPFGGSGTTGEVAAKLGRSWLLIELNPEYISLAKQRLGLFAVTSHV